MSRNCLAILCTLVFLLNASPAVSQDSTILRLGTAGSTINPLYLSLKHFSEEVQRAFPGKYKIELYPSSQLGAEKEMAQGMLMGSLQGAVLSWATMNMIGKSPKVDALSAPFLFKNTDAIYGIYKDFLAKETLSPEYERLGFKLLSCVNMGAVAMANNVRPVRTPADMNGLKIRIWEDKVLIKALADIGCNPVVMPYSEVLTALQQKQVDGVVTTDMHIIFDGIIDVVKYITEIRLLYGMHTLVLSKDWFEKQPAEIQKGILKIGEETTEFSYKMAKANSLKVLKDFESKGAKVERLDAKEFQLFTDKSQKALDMVREKAGKDYVDKIIKANDKY